MAPVTDDPLEFAKVITYVAAAYQGEVMDERRMAVYHSLLKPIPLDLLRRVARHIGKTELFFPPPAKWLELADELQREVQREAELKQITGEVAPQAERGAYYDDCSMCQDSGWAYVHPEHGGLISGDQADEWQAADPHHRRPGVRPCPCRASNPSYLRRHPPPTLTFQGRRTRRRDQDHRARQFKEY